MRLVWYFDFVSPYSYLQFEAYPELMQKAALRPVLFTTDMLLDYVEDSSVFDEPEMRRIADLPIGAARKL